MSAVTPKSLRHTLTPRHTGELSQPAGGAALLVRSIRTVRPPVTLLAVGQTGAVPAGQLWTGGTVDLISPPGTVRPAVTHPGGGNTRWGSGATAELRAGAGRWRRVGTVELVLSLPAVGDSVTDRVCGETELVRTLEVVSVTWTVQLVSSVHTVSGPVTPPGGVNTGPGLAPPLCWTAQI